MITPEQLAQLREAVNHVFYIAPATMLQLLPAISALVSPLICEGLHLHASTMRAGFPILPSDSSQMVYAGLLIRKASYHFGHGLKLRQHTCDPQLFNTLILSCLSGSVKYIITSILSDALEKSRLCARHWRQIMELRHGSYRIKGNNCEILWARTIDRPSFWAIVLPGVERQVASRILTQDSSSTLQYPPQPPS